MQTLNLLATTVFIRHRGSMDFSTSDDRADAGLFEWQFSRHNGQQIDKYNPTHLQCNQGFQFQQPRRNLNGSYLHHDQQSVPAVASHTQTGAFDTLGMGDSLSPPPRDTFMRNPFATPCSMNGTHQGTSPATVPRVTYPDTESTFRPFRINAPPLVAPPPVEKFEPDPDLVDFDACHKYLHKLDPADAQQLDINQDDVLEVKHNRVMEFTGKIYDALTAPYDRNVPVVSNLEGNSGGSARKFHHQQVDAEASVRHLLQTPSGRKTAKAYSMLMVNTAISIHEDGVSAERLRRHKAAVFAGRKPDGACRINTMDSCSVRLEKIVMAISANKLIAKDVVDDRNRLRLAEDPEAYLARKFEYFRSNLTRQANKAKRTAPADTPETPSKNISKAKRITKRGRESGQMEYETESESDSESKMIKTRRSS